MQFGANNHMPHANASSHHPCFSSRTLIFPFPPPLSLSVCLTLPPSPFPLPCHPFPSAVSAPLPIQETPQSPRSVFRDFLSRVRLVPVQVDGRTSLRPIVLEPGQTGPGVPLLPEGATPQDTPPAQGVAQVATQAPLPGSTVGPPAPPRRGSPVTTPAPAPAAGAPLPGGGLPSDEELIAAVVESLRPGDIQRLREIYAANPDVDPRARVAGGSEAQIGVARQQQTPPFGVAEAPAPLQQTVPAAQPGVAQPQPQVEPEPQVQQRPQVEPGPPAPPQPEPEAQRPGAMPRVTESELARFASQLDQAPRDVLDQIAARLAPVIAETLGLQQGGGIEEGTVGAQRLGGGANDEVQPRAGGGEVGRVGDVEGGGGEGAGGAVAADIGGGMGERGEGRGGVGKRGAGKEVHQKEMKKEMGCVSVVG